MLLIFLTYLSLYVICSLNFSIFATKILKLKDIRKTGSKNAGATNLFRQGSKKAAAIVLILDISRGAVLMACCKYLFSVDIYYPFIAIPMLFGNIFPLFHKFKGGKGVAVTIGIFAILNPIVWSLTIPLLIIILLWKKMMSLSTLNFVLAFTIGIAIWDSIQNIIVSSILTLIIFITHKENIRRLIKKDENPIV